MITSRAPIVVRALAAAAFVLTLAAPALPVTVANTQWITSGKAISKVKGLGKAKTDAQLVVTFFDGGDARVTDAFERTFDGGYVVTGRKRNKADLTYSTAATSLLEDVIETEVEAAVLRKAGEVVDVTVDIMTVSTKAHFNRKGTKVKLKTKAKAFGFADVDPRRRKTTYTVRTKGSQTP